ncbi:MAG TPA: tetraacyldisaccharide 4'-kinase [Syntrophales bacterium]|nr:tetraacyldisaccharide 4'-kinase [Syntrophales bacterium]
MEALIQDMWRDPRNEFRKPLHIFFSLLSLPYGGAVRARNRLFDSGFLQQQRIGCPVISVGNLTVGGTGKTPMVILLAGMLKDRGMRPAVLSRGYGGKNTADVLVVSDGMRVLAGPEEAGDEPVLIARRLGDVPVLAGPKRVVTGRHALEHFGVGAILLDDGFQHRYLHRDLDIVLLDSAQPLGNGFLLPRGPLREPPSALARAGAIAFTRSGEGDAGETDERLSGILSGGIVLRTRVRPTSLTTQDGEQKPLSILQGKRVFAFAGIARPDSFRRTIESLGGVIAGFRAFPDHHRYRAEDLGRIESESGLAKADILLATEKDLVKLPLTPQLSSRIHGLAIETEILEGRDRLEAALQEIAQARQRT